MFPMISASFKDALAAAALRNTELTGIYKQTARTLLSRSVANLAKSAADQREELGENLDSFSRSLPADLASLKIELDGKLLKTGSEGVKAAAGGEDKKLLVAALTHVQTAEDEDRELFSCLAKAASAGHPDAAAVLDAFSDQARKRAAWAQDHLDLLALS